MKYLVLPAVFGLGYLTASLGGLTSAAQLPGQPRVTPNGGVPISNPAIDIDGYLKVSREAAEHRATRRLTEDDFIKMSGEKGTIVLDARSKEMYDRLHVEGAINLSFPDIDIESLKKVLPDKEARILIYCNNNFNDPAAPLRQGRAAEAFRPKAKIASLNISTYITLYNYGYKKVYELGPLVDPAKTKLKLVSTKEEKSASPGSPTRPSCTSTTRPPSDPASAGSCVTHSTVVPRSRHAPRITSRTAAPSGMSSWPSGSSSSSTAGRRTKHRPSATRCRCPPDSSCGIRSSTPAMPSDVATSFTRRCASAAGTGW